MKQSSSKMVNSLSPQFTVANKKSDFVLLVITFVALEIINLILMLGVDKYFIVGIVFAVLTFCIIGAIMLSMYTFVLRVNGTEISGRTALGKRFRFDKSEIVNTRYQHYRATYRSCARTILTIETADLEIGIDSAMVGYQELVRYLGKPNKRKANKGNNQKK